MRMFLLDFSAFASSNVGRILKNVRINNVQLNFYPIVEPDILDNTAFDGHDYFFTLHFILH